MSETCVHGAPKIHTNSTDWRKTHKTHKTTIRTIRTIHTMRKSSSLLSFLFPSCFGNLSQQPNCTLKSARQTPSGCSPQIPWNQSENPNQTAVSDYILTRLFYYIYVSICIVQHPNHSKSMYSDVFYNMFYLSTCSVNVLDTNVFLCNFEARSQAPQ